MKDKPVADDGIVPERLTAAAVRSYIDFDGQAATGSEPSLQARIQSEGVAGLWGLLQQQGHAYLGDEVGMGKTRQAMGVIATQFLRNAGSRVVIVCSSKTVQLQWQSEWAQFLGSCYRLLDDRLLASADAARIEDLHLHDNLRSFHEALRTGEGRIHLLRYSSFSRPLPVDGDSPAQMLSAYAERVGVAGVAALTGSERALVEAHARPTDDWKEVLGHDLGRAYCQRIAALLTEGAHQDEPRSPLDLAVFDEAQYLRHVDNYQNEHIRLIFGRNVEQWLFVSATPLHASEDDILSLDTYLCRRPVAAHELPATRVGACGSCDAVQRCSRAAWHRARGHDVVRLLSGMMIRRTRTHGDAAGKRYGKIEYRDYEEVRHSGADDPFMALTMALVQKRLASALAGRNNRFRQGECASFESLSSSLGRNVSEPEPEFEPGKDHRQRKEADPAPDRNAIDLLNASFGRAMQVSGAGLPHAKLNSVADALFARSLADGGVDKTLVFVRRIDTVEELRDLLHLKFQADLDERIEAWREMLASPAFADHASPWGRTFWDQQGDDDEPPAEAVEGDAPPDSGEGAGNTGYRSQASLPYFEALKQRSMVKAQNGLLVSFRARLLRTDDASSNPLQGFLVKRASGTSPQRQHERWVRLLCALFGNEEVSRMRDDPAKRWLLADTSGTDDDAYKLASLQRCLLQSLRQTDILVDLYILHKHAGRTPDGSQSLADKFLWLLEQGEHGIPGKIASYLANQKEKLRRWIDHFELIVDKCFRAGEAVGWFGVHERVARVFDRVAPVVGRSGRLKNEHAVQQFMFPTHPNILVCTDVLKEGVDMHLFCDRVVHYGVAWTSGDLEQRTGRVDRLGSLIGRRIRAHRETDGQPLPRLGVEFPYLDGTLDSYQVRNVIREKIASDLRLDLGKRKDEIRELDAGRLAGDLSTIRKAAAQGNPNRAVFFPDSVDFVRREGGDDAIRLGPGMRYKDTGDAVRPRTAIDDRCEETIVPVPGSDMLLVRRSASGAHALVRRSLDPQCGEMLLTEDFLAPRGGTQAPPRVGEVLALDGWHGVPALDVPAFAFDPECNTTTMRVARPLAAAGSEDPVLVEALGEQFWLLRVPVQRVEDCAAGRGGVEQWMAERNSGRLLGFLMEDAGIVWCTALVLRCGGAELQLLEPAARRLARMAANWRSPSVASGTFGYRAWTAFPCVDAGLAWKENMKQNDVINCGNVLAGVQAWFGEAFAAVLDALQQAEGAAQPDGLEVSPLELLPGGLLRLRAQGRERFRLQAFLDPTGARAGNGQAGMPCIWWDYLASPRSVGPKPVLPCLDVDELPLSQPAGWDGRVVNGVGAFTGVDDSSYRYLAFCHGPADWDRARNDLIQAWAAVHDKMRHGGNFQRQWCRDALCAAV
ncbi:DEAD/DEAH box helicase family protein [uncultured Massilia sp.]|uniref:DEAD/DEAH box helicase family protein n=1 Tax=uncultured Massilia sp. TaxID=169973 RepID=UPI0025D7F5D8|nr:helicase-related protein [uncultured Massilia sp.]